MGAVKPGSELGADALGQFGGAQALDGVLGHFALPLRGDGGRVDERDPVDDLGAGAGQRSEVRTSRVTPRGSNWSCWSTTHLLDLLPEEFGHGGSRLEGDFHVVGGVQELRTRERKNFDVDIYIEVADF